MQFHAVRLLEGLDLRSDERPDVARGVQSGEDFDDGRPPAIHLENGPLQRAHTQFQHEEERAGAARQNIESIPPYDPTGIDFTSVLHRKARSFVKVDHGLEKTSGKQIEGRDANDKTYRKRTSIVHRCYANDCGSREKHR